MNTRTFQGILSRDREFLISLFIWAICFPGISKFYINFNMFIFKMWFSRRCWCCHSHTLKECSLRHAAVPWEGVQDNPSRDDQGHQERHNRGILQVNTPLSGKWNDPLHWNVMVALCVSGLSIYKRGVKFKCIQYKCSKASRKTQEGNTTGKPEMPTVPVSPYFVTGEWL